MSKRFIQNRLPTISLHPGLCIDRLVINTIQERLRAAQNNHKLLNQNVTLKKNKFVDAGRSTWSIELHLQSDNTEIAITLHATKWNHQQRSITSPFGSSIGGKIQGGISYSMLRKRTECTMARNPLVYDSANYTRRVVSLQRMEAEEGEVCPDLSPSLSPRWMHTTITTKITHINKEFDTQSSKGHHNHDAPKDRFESEGHMRKNCRKANLLSEHY